MSERLRPTPRKPTPRKPAPRGAASPSTLTRRGFVVAAALAGMGAVAACVSAHVPAADEGVGVVYDAPATGAPADVTVLMVGDILVHPSVWQSGERSDGTRSYDHLFANVADDVAAADIAMLDQETLLGGDALGLSGYPVFNGPQEIGDAEVAAGFDVMLHANNHALDKGTAGIEAELAFWRERHPDAVVTGMADSEEAAASVPVLERAGHRIAILNYTTSTNGIPLPEPWSVRMIDEATIAADVEAARAAGAEAIVACPHWGTEYAAGPDADQLRWAQVLADAGADVIIGNHPHVMQPFEVIQASDGRDVPLMWSTGNFVSGQDRKDSMVGSIARATLSFSADGVRVSEFRVTPLVTNKAGATGLTTYRLADYTEELAAGNGIRSNAGCADFTRQWCVDFCSERLGNAFDPETCELVWRA